MASQYLRGDVAPTPAPVLTATGITEGDILARNSSTGNVYGAKDQTWNTNEATTRADFVALFVGTSLQTKTAAVARVHGNGNDNIIMVANGSAEYRFDCDSANYVYGQLLGPAKDTGNALLSSKLKGVSAENEATHMCVENVTSATQIRCVQRVPPNMA